EFQQELIDSEGAAGRIASQYLLLVVFAFAYGLAMGAYNNVLQAIVAGVKVVVLFSLVLVICFPAFFIIQLILGSKLKVHQMLSIILAGFMLTTAIMVSFIPIVVFFLLTGGNYYFIQLLHIGIFVFSGIFGMKTIVDALIYSCEKKNVYPRTGVVVFRFWIVIIAFVGIQLAWNLRPFMGDRNEPFKLFRKYEGNFYTALIYSVEQLASHEDQPERKPASDYRSRTRRNSRTTADSLAADSLVQELMKPPSEGDSR
ncbi:MAG TPA: hypothetical protein VJ983_09640, partial [candidate division Zixibacteria bacterium]|nr:hypothetical protein [candidate division Zixibacteria bacterium]